MGIVNVTPDSFSDGGDHESVGAAVEHALQLADEGADILDIGGESTRPGALPVSVEEEIKRTEQVVKQLANQTNVPISIDTTKAEVAERAINAGADIINDISSLTADKEMAAVVSRYDVGLILMHMQGNPQTMQINPRYEHVIEEIQTYMEQKINWLEERGIHQTRIVIDPGIGFGKTAEHNLSILSHISKFRELGRPVLIGHSRKRFLKKVLGREVDERTYGTLGVAIALAMQHVDIIRVHEIQPTRDVLVAWDAIASQLIDQSK